MALPAALSCHSPCGCFCSSVLCQTCEKKPPKKSIYRPPRLVFGGALDDSCQRACGVIPSPSTPLRVSASKRKGTAYRAGSSDISQSSTKGAAAGDVRRGETSGILKPGSQKGWQKGEEGDGRLVSMLVNVL